MWNNRKFIERLRCNWNRDRKLNHINSIDQILNGAYNSPETFSRLKLSDAETLAKSNRKIKSASVKVSPNFLIAPNFRQRVKKTENQAWLDNETAGEIVTISGLRPPKGDNSNITARGKLKGLRAKSKQYTTTEMCPTLRRDVWFPPVNPDDVRDVEKYDETDRSLRSYYSSSDRRYLARDSKQPRTAEHSRSKQNKSTEFMNPADVLPKLEKTRKTSENIELELYNLVKKYQTGSRLNHTLEPDQCYLKLGCFSVGDRLNERKLMTLFRYYCQLSHETSPPRSRCVDEQSNITTSTMADKKIEKTITQFSRHENESPAFFMNDFMTSPRESMNKRTENCSEKRLPGIADSSSHVDGTNCYK